MGEQIIRVLIGKVGLDGHDRGAKIVARNLRDAGMEVIYTGIRQTVDQVVATAIQEDVNIIGLSFLSGDHMTLVPKIIQKLREKKIEDIPLIIGGIILKNQVPGLLKVGVSRVFLPGTAPEEIVQSIREVVSGSH